MSSSEHLAHHVLARRKKLDVNQLDVSAAGGPSNTKLTEIENGRLAELTSQTAKKLDKGLKWEPGSARRVWEGGEPTPLLPDVRPDLSAKFRRLLAEMDPDDEYRDKLEALVDELDESAS